MTFRFQALAFALVAWTHIAAAQTAAVKNPAAEWEGVWLAGKGGDGGGRDAKNAFSIRPGKEFPLLTPEYAAKQKEALAAQSEGRLLYAPQINCVPTGMPGMMYEIYALEIVPGQRQIIMVNEYNDMIRRIYTDGRVIPADTDPSYAGTSVGRWEGDTLVVDTTHLVEDGVIVPGMPRSDEMRIRERIRLRDKNTLVNEMTLTDPKALKSPWTVELVYARAKPERLIREYACAANNRYYATPDGKVQTVPWALQ